MGNRQPATKPEEVVKVYQEVARRAAKVLRNIAKKRPQLGTVSDELGIAKAYMDLYVRMPADPVEQATQSMDMWLDYARLWRSNWMKLLGATWRRSPCLPRTMGVSKTTDGRTLSCSTSSSSPT